jgi:c(7)-type cytochrome triheme protein
MTAIWRIAVGLLLGSLLVSAALAVEGDVVFKRKGTTDVGGTPVAVFPHWIHRIRYKCYACHPAPFRMKAAGNAITMDAIMAGKFCGACHNGKISWPTDFGTCTRCHTGVEK